MIQIQIKQLRNVKWNQVFRMFLVVMVIAGLIAFALVTGPGLPETKSSLPEVTNVGDAWGPGLRAWATLRMPSSFL